MVKIYTASWIMPAPEVVIVDGALAIDGKSIAGVGTNSAVLERFPHATIQAFPNAVILPGLINAHTHLELTAMRGYLEAEESDFFAWLQKLTVARMEKMTPDDIRVSATLGACEAARAGITSVADASDSARMSMRALREVGLRAIVYQESFGPDPKLTNENLQKLVTKVEELRGLESEEVKVGISPHAPYTVCGVQLERLAALAREENLPVMMHAAESAAEESLLRNGCGIFAESLAKRNIEWSTPGLSTIEYLKERRILDTKPLLAHCIRVDEHDIEALAEAGAKVAHCPRSNAKLGHGRAPLTRFLDEGVAVGLGSDSVASNNNCDILEEARFAALIARGERRVTAGEVLHAATVGGAACLGLSGKIGELKERALADFAVVSLSGIHQLPVFDPVVSTIFGSSGHDVLMTVVAGTEVFRDGKVVNVDEDRLKARIAEIARKL